MFGKDFQKQREVSGRGRFNQVMFNLGKFVNRVKGSDKTEDMAAYNPTVGVTYGSLPADYKKTERKVFKEAADFNKETKGRTDLDLNLDTGRGAKADVQYGADRFTAYERTTGQHGTGAPAQKTTLTLAFTELEVLDKSSVEQGF